MSGLNQIKYATVVGSDLPQEISKICPILQIKILHNYQCNVTYFYQLVEYIMRKNVTVFMLILIYAGLMQAARLKVEDTGKKITIDDLNFSLELEGKCVIKIKDNPFGTIIFEQLASSESFALKTEFEPNYRGSGISGEIQKRCTKLMQDLSPEKIMDFTSFVNVLNYTSLIKNLRAGMKIVNISCHGYVELTSSSKEPEKISKDCAEKIYDSIKDAYNYKDDMMSIYHVSKKIMSQKGINNAKEYYEKIKEMALNDGVKFEDN